MLVNDLSSMLLVFGTTFAVLGYVMAYGVVYYWQTPLRVYALWLITGALCLALLTLLVAVLTMRVP
jgi:hypothetical protein